MNGVVDGQVRVRMTAGQTSIFLWRSSGYLNEFIIQPHFFHNGHGPSKKSDSSTDSGDRGPSFKYLNRMRAILPYDQR